MQVEKPAPRPSARALSLTEMVLLALVVSVCIYPAFAPFNASKPPASRETPRTSPIAMRTERLSPGTCTWCLIGAIILVTLVWMRVAGLRFAWDSAALTVGACAGLAVLAAFYRRGDPSRVSPTR